jgi:GTPase Era involved in 16S rRNA processing
MRRFILVGQTGVGKSTFVNGTFGKFVAATSQYEPCTKIVERFAYGTPWGDVCLIDTPGLSESNEVLDVEYVDVIKGFLTRNPIDHLLYVTRLNDNRFRPDEKRALNLLVAALETDVWRNAWIVLTFAGSVPREQRDSALRERITAISDYIAGRLNRQFVFAFQRAIYIDNIVVDWCPGAPAIAYLLAT